MIFPFLLFCYCWAASLSGVKWKKTKLKKNILHDPTVFFHSCCIYPLWILCDCTVLYVSITGNYTVLYVCREIHTLTHAKMQTNPPIQYSNLLIRMHSHWPCVEYLCTVVRFLFALWQCISKAEYMNYSLNFYFFYTVMSALYELMLCLCFKWSYEVQIYPKRKNLLNIVEKSSLFKVRMCKMSSWLFLRPKSNFWWPPFAKKNCDLCIFITFCIVLSYYFFVQCF